MQTPLSFSSASLVVVVFFYFFFVVVVVVVVYLLLGDRHKFAGIFSELESLSVILSHILNELFVRAYHVDDIAYRYPPF